MNANRYTSFLYNNGKITARRLGNDLLKLTVKLLSILDTQNSSASGMIRDNFTGQIVHRCRKVATE